MNKRYLKLLVLYVVSSGVSSIVGRFVSSNRFVKCLLETTVSFGVFSYGLKVMKRRSMDR
ncbi:hypothetical protein [Staphylococcus felis]|uniref:hypothetical protein n=1 Tax=Staphylococcus felis TaxID=46127 RepID=UPI000CD0DB69|nr:hypothetical protein [Staphylococcus felis]AVP36340.1 hypothetical protein C7J90_05010 [Staphylococcus felis]PNZ34499.1 hypothetical protein CD143_08775 [Staphylococcus felis]QQB03691.1 hypothetical protein I6H71_01645 [Staphylococcus felis]